MFFQEAIVATPASHAREVIKDRFDQQRNGRRCWSNRDTRILFHVFFLMDGQKDHLRLCEMLHVSEDDVRHAIVFLKDERLVTIEVHGKEKEQAVGELNTALLSQSFDEMKDDGEVITKKFYEIFFRKGRETFSTNEIGDLFAGVDAQQQYVAFWGALAFVMAGVLAGKNVVGDLQSLGARHTGYRVKPGYYGIAGAALIDTFQWYYTDYRGLPWRQELRDAWVGAYTLVAGVMVGAAGE